MTTEREKIIQLARGIFGGIYKGTGENNTYVFSIEELEAFYRASQAEAFEAAANKLRELSRLGYSTPHFLEDAIREMAKGD